MEILELGGEGCVEQGIKSPTRIEGQRHNGTAMRLHDKSVRGPLSCSV